MNVHVKLLVFITEWSLWYHYQVGSLMFVFSPYCKLWDHLDIRCMWARSCPAGTIPSNRAHSQYLPCNCQPRMLKYYKLIIKIGKCWCFILRPYIFVINLPTYTAVLQLRFARSVCYRELNRALLTARLVGLVLVCISRTWRASPIVLSFRPGWAQTIISYDLKTIKDDEIIK